MLPPGQGREKDTVWQMPLGPVLVAPVAADSVTALADSGELVDFEELAEPEVIEEFKELGVRSVLVELEISAGFFPLPALFSTY